MKRRDWIKVRKDWWESPSHRLISAAARMFGTYLLYLADGDPTWRETGVGRLVGPGGVALGSDEVSRLAQVRSRDGRRWVAELLACGTLHLDESGYLYFPNYREHQENRSAKSMRKVRKGVHSEQGCEHNVNGEEEEEAEVEEEVDLKAPQPPAGVVPPAKKRASRKKPKGSYGVDPASVEDTDTVLGWIAKARKWCGFKASRSDRYPCKPLLRRGADGHLRVVARRLENGHQPSCREGQGQPRDGPSLPDAFDPPPPRQLHPAHGAGRPGLTRCTSTSKHSSPAGSRAHRTP